MNSTRALDFPYVQQEESEKIINFSSYTIQAVKNIPSVLLSFIIVPFYVCFFVPLANIMLWRLHRKLQKEFNELKRDIPNMPYERAKDGYDLLGELAAFTENVAQAAGKEAKSFLIRGIYRKFCRIEETFRGMQQSIAAVLFVQADPTPLAKKEKEAFSVMNDIWGDDQDQVYARHTHYHLSRKLKSYGV
jgi:hypothetical protein